MIGLWLRSSALLPSVSVALHPPRRETAAPRRPDWDRAHTRVLEP